MGKIDEVPTIFGTDPKNTSFDSKKPRNIDFKNVYLQGFIRVVILFIIAFIVYYAISSSLNNMQYWVQQAVALVLTLLFLWAYDSAQNSPSEFGLTIVIFIFLFFSYNISTHYFVRSDINKIQKTEVKRSTILSTPTPSKITMEKIVHYYYPGDNPRFDLKPNEETGWLNIPINNLKSAEFAADGSFFFIQKGVAPIFVREGRNTHLPNGDFKLRATKKPVFISIKIS